MDGADKFQNQAQFLCRFLGLTMNYGNEMAQWCLKANGKIVPRRSAVPLNTSQLNNNEEILKRNVFTNFIRKRYGDSINFPPLPIKTEDLDFFPYEDGGEKNTPRLIPDTEAVYSTGLPVLQQPVTYRILNNKVYLSQGGSMQVAKAAQRVLDEDGKLVGTYSFNTMLNTLVCDVEFPDGATNPYTANIITKNIHNSLDSDGHISRTFGEILNYYKTANTVAIDDATDVGRNGRRYQRKTTAGWNLLIGMKGVS